MKTRREIEEDVLSTLLSYVIYDGDINHTTETFCTLISDDSKIRLIHSFFEDAKKLSMVDHYRTLNFYIQEREDMFNIFKKSIKKKYINSKLLLFFFEFNLRYKLTPLFTPQNIILNKAYIKQNKCCKKILKLYYNNKKFIINNNIDMQRYKLYLLNINFLFHY